MRDRCNRWLIMRRYASSKVRQDRIYFARSGGSHDGKVPRVVGVGGESVL